MIIDYRKIEVIKEKQKQKMLQEQMTRTIMNAEIEKKKNEAFINSLVNTVMQQTIKLKQLQKEGR